MFLHKFNDYLYFNPTTENKGDMERIKYRKFQKSNATKQQIKDAGLENEIDDFVEVESQYKIKKNVGYGATSVVYKAYTQPETSEKDSKMLQADKVLQLSGTKQQKEYIAIKKVKNVFENDIYAHRILRELKLLRLLKGHKNIV